MATSPSTTTSHHTITIHHHPSPPPTPTNPYPTTFVQADTTSFKQVVQMLTGSSDTTTTTTTTLKHKHPIPPMKPKKPSKLYERRHNNLKNFKINPLTSKFTNEILSPCALDFPKLVLSPVTPLISDPFNPELDVGAEEKAIAEKGFYLHPSPATTPREVEPQLLPLFPLTSPRVNE